jgi:hypothetical protein
MLAYSWTFLDPGASSDLAPRLYPYVASSTTNLTQHNWDYDRPADSTNAGLRMLTPARTIELDHNYVSGDDQEISSSHQVNDTESNTTWAVRCWTEAPGLDHNVVTFWMTDQDGQALPMFSRSTIEAPPWP